MRFANLLKKWWLFVLPMIVFYGVAYGQHVPGRGSQKKVSVSLKVKDVNNRESLPAVLVVLTNLKDSTRMFSTTDDHGVVTFKVRPGKWRVAFKLVGYKDTSFVFSATEDVFLGIVYLKPISKQLKEVEVKVSASEESADRTTFLITKAIKENTTTARDVLQKLPGIQYNPLDDAFMVDNNPNILILVNGMEKSPEYVKNIPPDRILKIEIIRDPTGRYGLEGYSAIINIILRDDYVGYDFSYSGMVAYSPFLKGVPSKIPFAFSGISGSYSYNKNTIYASVYSWMPRPPRIELDSTHMYIDSTLTIYYYNLPPDYKPINNIGKVWGMRASVGFDHIPHPGQIISIELSHRRDVQPSVFQGDWIFKDSTIVYLPVPQLHIIHVDIDTFSRNTSSFSQSNGISGYVKTQPDKTNTLVFDVSYRKGITNSENNFLFGAYKRQEQTQSQTTRWRAIAEWEKSIMDNLGSIIGMGVHRRKEAGQFEFHTYINDLQTQSDTIQTEMSLVRFQTYAYLTYSIKKKWTFKGGTAFEYYDYSVDTNRISLSVLQPALDVLWKFHKILSLRLRYRVNFRYPTIRELLPSLVSINAFTYQTGNPELKPYYLHRISLQLGAYGGRARIEPYFQWANNYIANSIDTISGLRIVLKPVNAGQFQRYGLNTAIPIPLGKKIFALINFDIYKEILKVNNEVHSLSDFTSFFMISYTFMNRKLSVGLMQINSVSRNLTATGFKMGGERHADMWIFFLRSFWLKRRLSVGISYIPPLRLLGADYAFITYDDLGMVKRWSITDIVPTRNSIALRVSYSFSKGEIKKRKKERDEEEMVPQMF
ncbi:MAG: TonB-dependent receptor [Chlorobi bacterium]|nr:TonB-dependent receptor [Chlorobiota bacterium]